MTVWSYGLKKKDTDRMVFENFKNENYHLNYKFINLR